MISPSLEPSLLERGLARMAESRTRTVAAAGRLIPGALLGRPLPPQIDPRITARWVRDWARRHPGAPPPTPRTPSPSTYHGHRTLLGHLFDIQDHPLSPVPK